MKAVIFLPDSCVRDLLNGKTVYPSTKFNEVEDIVDFIPEDTEEYPTCVLIKTQYADGIYSENLARSWDTISSWSHRWSNLVELDVDINDVYGFKMSDGDVKAKNKMTYIDVINLMEKYECHYMWAVIYGIKAEQVVAIHKRSERCEDVMSTIHVNKNIKHLWSEQLEG